MTYFDDYEDDFSNIIAEELQQTLNDELTNDYAKRCAKEIVGHILHDQEMRYLVIDGETGQLESRSLHESYEEAEKTAGALNLKSYYIGTMFVEAL